MNQLLRESKIVLNLIEGNKWEILDADGDMLVDADSNFLIYMKSVRFKKGKITGVYLGSLKEDSPLLTTASAKFVDIDEHSRFSAEGKSLYTARMIAVNNKKNVILIIASE